ncbi:UxaA family hydrolase [Occallatibacter savannae]|uniref:UxaA family hydrolase n=1 Tax=Occallatibacter savannae TaxID=1002691 RepID=UPI000D6914BE|nr:altronate dehydratase [Occallatibacter savannae]
MPDTVLQIDTRDNVLVALSPLPAGTTVYYDSSSCPVTENIPAKQKLALVDLAPGDVVIMYGMVVGEATQPVSRGGLLSTRNTRHRAGGYTAERNPVSFELPNATAWAERTFMGYHRADGQVGTRNYWLVLPLVFCENRNVDRMREALEEELGYGSSHNSYRGLVREMVSKHARTASGHALEAPPRSERVFPNVDGIRFLTHQGGCGGTRQDAQALCGLLAGYIHHPNVAGATVLSLGCQNAQSSMLMDELRARDPKLTKPVLFFDQQRSGRETVLMTGALEQTFAGLAEANRATRAPAPLSALTVGLKCGGSDGFSGISANPTLGYISDLLGELGGKSILSEFPELHGVEQELINRCATDELAQRFYDLMQAYSARAKAVHSGFEMNPSPGNIEDGLITDAIKSAGAARKGGVAPVRDVLDFPQYATKAGLTLLCTPGNDVECVTAQAGAGANLVLFTTGLGTPTGNPVAPVMKISTNSQLAERMADIIDFDAGGIVTGEKTIPECAAELLELCIEVANGTRLTKAEEFGQNDFIPWKRGVSL